ncbi:MAG: 50S ribosomal protein L24e [Methanomicrobiaceae archaeon]|nr:50S ribosomal protein L24e [Methanomicrobiaceae archaeon]
MVHSHICSFCGEKIEPGTGKMYVRKDGTIFYFCSSKCQNNYRLGRIPRRVVWTKTGRKALGKE